MEAISKLGRVFDFAIDKMARLADVILIFLMLSVCADVILRYFFNRPQAWVAEISEYLLLYITFLGAAWVLKNEGHVIVDVLVAQVSPTTRLIFGIISSVIGAFVLLVVLWFGTLETLDLFKRGVHNPSVLEFPKAPLVAIIPFGSLFFMIQFLRRTFGFLRSLRESR
jgi:TRAP-type C4-dicarboxylate transport system permease small subunit